MSSRLLPSPATVLASAVVLLLVAGSAVAGTRGADPPERIAFLARADNPVDALAASAVAAQLGGIVLLTSPADLSPEAADGLRDFDPDVVVLAGGSAALAPAVQDAVEALGYATERVAGASRLETAQRIAALLADRAPAFLPRDATAVAALTAEEAAHAATADRAASAAEADEAASAATAATAGTADDAEALGGYAASDLIGVRVATASNEVAIPGGILSWATLSTMTVEVPTDGWLAVDAAVTFAGGNTVQTVGCRILVDGGTSGAGTLAESGDVLGVQTVSCGVTGAIAVTAGTHTVTLQAASETSGLRAGTRTLRAISTPFGSAG